jgi:hypothetical protein
MLAGLLALTGCSSATAAPLPAAAVLVQVGPGGDVGQNDGTVCSVSTRTFVVPRVARDLGVGPQDVLQEDGSEDGVGDMVHVRCSVRAGGGAFTVDTAIATDDGRSAAISGTMSLTSSDARATFEQGGVTFTSQGSCAVDFSASHGMDIQPGRVWAVVTCPRATDGLGNTCLASAAFLFEGCQQ